MYIYWVLTIRTFFRICDLLQTSPESDITAVAVSLLVK